jgi:hypothetical protein
MSNEAHIIVACGGSGIKTITRLNQLLSQDDYWRRRLDNDVYYVIVDTDVEEMKEFQEAVGRDLAGSPDSLHITSISLAEGEATLQPLINRYLLDPFRSGSGRDPRGRERLLKHWWNRGPDAPFSAPSVIGLTKGAGQCPPISYFLTWCKLKSLETRFDDLIKAIQRRQGGFSRTTVLNFLVVCSLAGGTGRGSWEIVAFKLREMFRRYNMVPKPRAFLFDASIFEDLSRSAPRQRLPMRVNSLTGISQLSCWVVNRLAGQQEPSSAYRYHLPSLESPEDDAADVLKADLYRDRNEAAPVNHSYLVFSSNGVSSLENHLQYYEMVGAAIYAALSKSSITRQEINSNRSYVGLATATFEVNATALRRYFEAQAHVCAAKMLVKADEEEAEAQAAAFLNATQLEVNVTTSDPGTRFRPDPQGLFFQRVLARLDEKSRNRLGALEQALARDDPDEVKRMTRAALTVQEDVVRACFEETIRDMKLDPAGKAEELARGLFERTRSVTNVQLFIQKAQAALDVELTEMPADMPLGRDDPVRMAVEFASRPFPIGFRRYNEGECRALLEATRRAVLRVNYQALKKTLAEYYEGWSKQMDRLRANAADVAECLQRLERKFVKNREGAIPGCDDAFRELFTDRARPELALTPRFSAMKFYRRELKPVMGPDDDLRLLQPVVQLKKDLFDAGLGALLQDRVSQSDLFDAQKRLTARLERAICNTVALPDEFMADNFSVRRVIPGLRQAWRERLAQGMSADVRVSLEERFEEFFGFYPQRADDGGELSYDLPETDDFIFAMGASLARTCRPYWQLRGAEDERTAVMLFLPTARNKEEAERAIRGMLGDSSRIDPEVFPQAQTQRASEPSTSNPYVILAYSTRGTNDIKQIASLDYHTDGELLPVMRSVEDPRGETIFSGGENGGLGYVDPLYVLNDEIAGMRWRPWAEGQVEVVAERRTAEALMYAMFPGDDETQPLLRNLQAQLREIGWPMPLVAHKGRNRYVLTRLPHVQEGDGFGTDHTAHRLAGWDVDRPLAPVAGLHNVWAALHEDRREGAKPEWRERMLEESDLFWNVVLPRINVARGTPAFRDLLREYCAWLGKNLRETDDDRNRNVWARLLDAANALG